MGNKITEKELGEIKKTVKEEFPDDPALQHVHIAKKSLLAKQSLPERVILNSSSCRKRHRGSKKVK